MIRALAAHDGSSFASQTPKTRQWVDWALRFLAAGEETSEETNGHFLTLALCTLHHNEEFVAEEDRNVWCTLNERATDVWRSLTCSIFAQHLRRDPSSKFDESYYYKVQDIQMFAWFRTWFTNGSVPDFKDTNDFNEWNVKYFITPNVAFNHDK